MKLAIIGSRTFDNVDLFNESINQIKEEITHVVSGGAKGADKMGEEWAIKNKIPCTIFYPNWEQFKKAAGMIRNRDIINSADVVLAFWDGTSKGTQNSISLAQKANKKTYLVRF